MADPVARGQTLAAFFLRLEPGLWRDIVDSGLVPDPADPEARAEWEAFALHACVRGLVAASGFGPECSRSVDALHDAVAERWKAAPDAWGDADERRAQVAIRYEQYGEIARNLAARGDDAVIERLGEVAARNLSGTDIASAELGRMLGELHEAVSHGAAESVREPEA